MKTYTATKKGPGRVYRAGTKKAGWWLSRGVPIPRTVITTNSVTNGNKK